jgi:hypothetical protein
MPKGDRTTIVTMHSGVKVKVYAGAKIRNALDELTQDMTLYHGVRFGQVLEAVYEQGKKDGARRAFEEIEEKVTAAKAAIPHRTPGRPRTKRRKRR